MKILKRVIPLILALLMILGTMSVAFPAAFALQQLELDSSSHVGIDKDGKNFKVTATGTPNPSVFDDDITGFYEFKITGSGTFTLTLKKPSESSYHSVSTSDGSISGTGKFRFGDVTVTRDGEKSWEDGDIVKVMVVPRRVDATKTAFINRSKIIRAGQSLDTSSALTSISRNGLADFRFVIVDPNFPADTVIEGENASNKIDGKVDLTGIARYVTNTESFSEEAPKSGRKSTEILKVDGGVGGKLAFQLDLRNMVYSGKGNTMRFNFGYTINGQTFEYELSQNFPECKQTEFNAPPSGSDDDDDKVLDPLIPHIIVSNYSYGNLQVSAGQVIELQLEFTNTSASYNLENVVMNVDAGEGFSITNASNSYYLEDLDVGEKIAKTISLQAMPSAKAQSYPIKISFTFQYVANDTRKSGNSDESISIPISQPDRFQVNEVQVPQSLMLGEEYPLSISFVNKGKAEIYNVSVELRGNIANSGEGQFVGNVASGTESSADFFINAMEEGALSGQMIVSYEDSNMNIKEVSKPFTIMVESYGGWEPEFPIDPNFPTGPAEPEDTTFWTGRNIALSIAGVAMAGMTCYLTILRIKVKRSEGFDETL